MMEVKYKLANSQFGPKIQLFFPYDSEIISKLKTLDWNITHRRWNGQCWEIDAKTIAVLNLETYVGFEVPEEIKRQIRELEKVKIVLSGTTGRIGRISRDIERLIEARLQFQPKGYEWSNAFRRGKWDGFIKLYRYGYFPVGLLKFVLAVLEENGISYKIVDNRKVENQIQQLEWKGFTLRPYQQEVFESAINQGQGHIAMPTGSGKTLVALKIIHEISKSAVVLVHRKELLYQWQREFLKNLGVEAGLVGDGNFEEKTFTVAMMQTVNKKPLQRNYDILVADECHHIPADTFQQVAERIESKYRYGLSATPWREDGKEMLIWAQTGTLITRVGLEKMVTKKWLAEPKFLILDYGGYIHGDNWAEEYRNLVENEKRNTKIIKYVTEAWKNDFKIYVDVKRIKHGKYLAKKLKDEGVKAVFVSGRDSSGRRERILKDFEDNSTVLVSTLIKEGVDLPGMNMIVLAGGGKSKIATIQVIGRALRPKINVNEAYIVDLKDDTGKYVRSHFYERKGIMQSYYGVLYKPLVK